MSNPLRNCSNCGGRIAVSSDGRVVSCVYCGSTNSVAIDPRALAAGMALDSKTVHAGFDRLLKIFRETLPAETTVHESGLLFKNITAFDVVLGEFTFRLSRERDRLVAQRIATVRGIKLKTETMSLESWITDLAGTLAEMATASAAARDAFARIAR